MVLSLTDALSVVVRGHCQSPHQLAGVDLQAVCQLEDVVQGDVAPSSLHLADEGPVQTAGVGQLFLAVTQLMAASPDTLTEGFRRR